MTYSSKGLVNTFNQNTSTKYYYEIFDESQVSLVSTGLYVSQEDSMKVVSIVPLVKEYDIVNILVVFFQLAVYFTMKYNYHYQNTQIKRQQNNPNIIISQVKLSALTSTINRLIQQLNNLNLPG
jgi:hypothetical protein